MATVFKRQGKGNWFIDWFDHTGKRQSKSARTTDKAAATRIANKLEADAALRRERVIDTAGDDLVKHLDRPVKEHLADFISALRAKGCSDLHVTRTQTTIEKACIEAKFVLLRDVGADGVNRVLAQMRKEDLSARTIGSHAQSLKSFTGWLVTHGKLASDPLVSIKKPSVEDDRRKLRRYLSHDEWRWLDSATRQSVERFDMTGMARALLYATAIQTGLRSNELRSLTRGKLSLKSDPPFITAEARATKNKKTARQYIQPELAGELTEYVGKKLAGAPVFAMPATYDVATMLRADMAEARSHWLDTFSDPQKRIEQDASDFLKPIDSEGEHLDFHSLRHTTASWLIAAGADIKTVQAIMRHSDIKLTLDRYGHLFPGSEAAAIERIRSAFTQSVELRQTGTNAVLGVQHLVQHSGRFSARKGAKECNEAACQETIAFTAKPNEKAGETQETLGLKKSAPARTRTLDPVIKSHLLYQLSYKGGLFGLSASKWIRIVASFSLLASASDVLAHISLFLTVPASFNLVFAALLPARTEKTRLLPCQARFSLNIC